MRSRSVIHFVYFDIDTGFYPGTHHGLASLFAAVRAAGCDYRFTHLTRDLGEADFVELVGRSGADVFGLSAMTNQFKFVRKFAPALAAATGRPILVGGVHATLLPQEACAVEGVTAACRGEGEIFLTRWLEAIVSGGDWRSVPGACYRDAGGLHVSAAEYPADLDTLGAPEYDAFDMPRILKDLGGRLSVVVSRGCPYRCAFCCNEALRMAFPRPPHYVRMRSPRNAVAMVEQLVRRHQPASIRFEDDLLLVNPAWRREFLEQYRRCVHLPFECNCRADVVTGELADDLRRAGCASVDIGVESGDEHIRNDVLGKNISDRQIEQAFTALHAAGLHTYSYNMIGLPFETPEMARRTYEMNRRISPSAGAVFYFFPYPGTQLKALAEANNLLRDGYDEVSSYTESISVNETHAAHRQLRAVYRKLKMYLWLRRFRTFFPLPRPLKAALAQMMWGAFCLCPPMVNVLIADTRLKRWLRRMAFRLPPPGRQACARRDRRTP